MIRPATSSETERLTVALFSVRMLQKWTKIVSDMDYIHIGYSKAKIKFKIW